MQSVPEAVLPSKAVIVIETVAPDKHGDSSDKFTKGLAAGLTLGGISSLVLIGFIVVLLVRLQKKKNQQNTNADKAMTITNITYEAVLSDSINSPASVEPVDYMKPASMAAAASDRNFTAIVRGRVVS